jgi:7-carboxy-7-deazaguanine synthase
VTGFVVVNEIYVSLQGESTFAGLPCVFVRLTGCNLRCSYCDTAYAFREGRRRPIGEVVGEIRRRAEPYARAGGPVRLPLVELTGGEPLLQRGAYRFLAAACDAGFTVLVETSGALDIGTVDPRVRRIVDLKCPSSGECARNHWANLDHLRPTDELKFVIATVEDYTWARHVLGEYHLDRRCPVLFSWASPLSPRQRHPALRPVPAGHTPLDRRGLAERILADALPVRFQAQLHKVIWPPDRPGV